MDESSPFDRMRQSFENKKEENEIPDSLPMENEELLAERERMAKAMVMYPTRILGMQFVDPRGRFSDELGARASMQVLNLLPTNIMPMGAVEQNVVGFSMLALSSGLAKRAQFHLLPRSLPPALETEALRKEDEEFDVKVQNCVVVIELDTEPSLSAHLGATVEREGAGGSFTLSGERLLGVGDALALRTGVGATNLRGDHTASLSYTHKFFDRLPEGPLCFPCAWPNPIPQVGVSLYRERMNRSLENAHQAVLHGLKVNYTHALPVDFEDTVRPLPVHDISYSAVDRRVIIDSHCKSSLVRKDAGHHFKSSLLYTYTYDCRDDPRFPTQGWGLRASQEVAGFGGCARFLKSSLFFQGHKSTGRGTVLSLRSRFGMLLPILGDQTHILDRFHLGSPQEALLGGFASSQMGPEENGAHVGGDLMMTANLSFNFPLPQPLPRGLRGHVTAGVANLATWNDIRGVKMDKLSSVLKTTRASVGLGLSLNLGQLRLNTGFYLPLASSPSDVLSGRGFHLGCTADLF